MRFDLKEGRLLSEVWLKADQLHKDVAMKLIKEHDDHIAKWESGPVTEREWGYNETTRSVWVRTMFIMKQEDTNVGTTEG